MIEIESKLCVKMGRKYKLNDVPKKPPKMTLKIHHMNHCEGKTVEVVSQTNNVSVKELVQGSRKGGGITSEGQSEKQKETVGVSREEGEGSSREEGETKQEKELTGQLDKEEGKKPMEEQEEVQNEKKEEEQVETQAKDLGEKSPENSGPVEDEKVGCFGRMFRKKKKVKFKL